MQRFSFVEQAINSNYSLKEIDDTGILQMLDHKKNNLLHLACQYDNDSFGKWLIKKMPSLLYKENNNQKTAMHYVCKFRQEKIAKFLIKNKLLMPQHIYKYGDNLLHIACKYEQQDIIKFYLTKHDPLLYQENDGGYTHLFTACQYGKRKVVELFINYDKAIMNIVDSGQNTLLHIACRFGRLQLTEFLITKNPLLLKAKNDYGDTPLHVACLHNNAQVVIMLIRHNPLLLELKNKQNNTAIETAINCLQNTLIEKVIKAEVAYLNFYPQLLKLQNPHLEELYMSYGGLAVMPHCANPTLRYHKGKISLLAELYTPFFKPFFVVNIIGDLLDSPLALIKKIYTQLINTDQLFLADKILAKTTLNKMEAQTVRSLIYHLIKEQKTMLTLNANLHIAAKHKNKQILTTNLNCENISEQQTELMNRCSDLSQLYKYGTQIDRMLALRHQILPSQMQQIYNYVFQKDQIQLNGPILDLLKYDATEINGLYSLDLEN
jgi:ankyrin repeat protein